MFCMETTDQNILNIRSKHNYFHMNSKINNISKKYEYTKDSDYLTNEQRDFYEENGYVIIPKLVDSDLINKCKQRFVDICNKKVSSKGVTVMRDVYLRTKNVQGEFVVSRIQNFHLDNILSKYIVYKPIVDIVQSIIGPNITCNYSMLINKPPNSIEISSRHPLHQDLHFIPFRPANSIVGVWTAMEKVNEDNGCLFIVPKSHKIEMQTHAYPRNDNTYLFQSILNENAYSPVNLIMEQGDTIFFHPHLLHGSRANVSKGFRKVLFAQYVDTYCNLVDMKGFDDKEMLAVFRRWGYTSNSLRTNWKNKCWFIRGSPGYIHATENKL